MIHDFVVEFESGDYYDKAHFDTYDEALEYYETHFNKYDYASLKKRTMNPVTMADEYDHLLTYEA